MLPMNDFINKITEDHIDNDREEDKLVWTGDEAKKWIHKINNEGAEFIINEIKREFPDWVHGEATQESHEDMNRVEYEDVILYWSKSGQDPKVILSAQILDETCCAGTASAPGTAAAAPADGGSQATGVARFKAPLGADPYDDDTNLQRRFDEDTSVMRRVEAGQTDPSDKLEDIQLFHKHNVHKDGTYVVPNMDEYKQVSELESLNGTHDEESDVKDKHSTNIDEKKKAAEKKRKETRHDTVNENVMVSGSNPVGVQSSHDVANLKVPLDDEDRVNTVDRGAVESAAHFMLRGVDDDTVGSLIDEACMDTYDTEEALTKLKDLVKKNGRVASHALDEEEMDGLNKFRHNLRKRMFGMAQDISPHIINTTMYDGPGGDAGFSSSGLNVAGAVGGESVELDEQDDEGSMDLVNPEQAEKEAERAKEVAKAKEEYADKVKRINQKTLQEKDDPNKGSQMAGFRHKGGPQALANAIEQMDWNGPGSQFDVFLNELTVDAYNMIGDVAKKSASVESLPDDEEVDVDVDIDAEEPELPDETEIPEEEPEIGDDIDLGNSEGELADL